MSRDVSSENGLKGLARWLLPVFIGGAALATPAMAADPVRKGAATKPVSPAAVTEAEVAGQNGARLDGLSGVDVYQILLGEIALKRGETAVAAQAYADAAQRTGDETLFGRAVQVAVAAQRYDTALEVSQRWVAANPNSASARHALVNVLSGTGRGGEMLPHLERLLALDEEARPRNILHMSRLFSGAEPEAALTAVRSLVAPYPALPESHFVVASMARQAGQTEVALASVREASRLRPGWAVATYLEAQLQQTPREAIAVWSRFLEGTKNFEQAYIQRARLQVGEKQYKEARADFEAALALNPGSVDTLYALGILSLQLDDRPGAEKYFLRLEGRDFAGKGLVEYQLGLLAQDRNDPEAAKRHFLEVGAGDHFVASRTQAALILSRQGKPDEARKQLAGIEASTPADRARLAIAEAQLLREAKQFEAALTVLEKALTAQPNEPDLLYDMAMLAERLKKVEVVETTLAKLIELRPNHPHAYNALGYSWAERNIKLEEARKLIARALELAPQDPFILDSMGWVMYRLGQPKAALVHLEDAYRQRRDPEIAAHLGEVLWTLGRQDDARRVWREARERDPDNEVLSAVIERFNP